MVRILRSTFGTPVSLRIPDPETEVSAWTASSSPDDVAAAVVCVVAAKAAVHALKLIVLGAASGFSWFMFGAQYK